MEALVVRIFGERPLDIRMFVKHPRNRKKVKPLPPEEEKAAEQPCLYLFLQAA